MALIVCSGRLRTTIKVGARPVKIMMEDVGNVISTNFFGGKNFGQGTVTGRRGGFVAAWERT
jgi:hypothetical protein